MSAGDHHGCVVSSLVRFRFEDESRFGPRCKSTLQLRVAKLSVRNWGIRSRKRDYPGREGTVPGEGLMYERVRIGDRFTARTGGYNVVTPMAFKGASEGQEHENDPGREERDHAGSDHAEAGDFGPQVVGEPVTADRLLGFRGHRSHCP